MQQRAVGGPCWICSSIERHGCRLGGTTSYRKSDTYLSNQIKFT